MKNLLQKFPVNYIGASIGMPMYSEYKFFKIPVAQNSVTEISWEILDQYYQNNCGQSWVMSLYPVVK